MYSGGHPPIQRDHIRGITVVPKKTTRQTKPSAHATAPDAMAEAESRITKTRRQNATGLDLSFLGLTELPESFVHLSQLRNVSVNSFLDTFGPTMRLQQPRHTVAPVSPGQELYSHAAQSARSHYIDAETR